MEQTIRDMNNIASALSTAQAAMQDAQSRAAEAAMAISDPESGGFDVSAHLDLKQAQLQLAANAVVVRSLDESLGNILDILS